MKYSYSKIMNHFKNYESLCYTPETYIILYINIIYLNLKNKNKISNKGFVFSLK